MAKLTLDDMMRMQDEVAEFLENGIGREISFRRGVDEIYITFKVEKRPINEPEHRDSVPADKHVISDTPHLDADQRRRRHTEDYGGYRGPASPYGD